MRKIIGSLVAIAGLAAGAEAQVNTTLRYEASRDGGATWSTNLDALPGDTITVRALVTYTGPLNFTRTDDDGSGTTALGTGTVMGLSQVAFQPVLTGGLNWEAAGGDNLLTNSDQGNSGTQFDAQGIGPHGGSRSTPIGTVPSSGNALGRITPFGANATSTSSFLRGLLGTGTAAGLLRIAQANVTNWIGTGPTSGATANNNVNGGGGVSIAQLAPSTRLGSDPAANFSNTNVVVFRFAFTLSGDTNLRTITVDTPANGIGRTLSGNTYVDNTKWFIRWQNGYDGSTAQSSNSDTTVGGVEVTMGHINITPTPGTLALLGLGGLVAARRRR